MAQDGHDEQNGERTAVSEALVPAHARASGEVRAEFVSSSGRTQAARVYQAGGLRLSFPHVTRGCEGVIVNTGGGVAGGDQAKFSFDVGTDCDVTLTTQAAEKIYRAQSQGQDQEARIEVSLRVETGAALEWLPQETILFDKARLVRRLDVDVVADASVTLVESVVFGRLAMGEINTTGLLRDRWRVRRDGQLIFADELSFDGAIGSILNRPACAGGGRACATLLHVSPSAESRLDALREALKDVPCEWGASAWNGFLFLRFVSPSPQHVRAAMVMAMGELRGRDAPRVWN